MTRALAVLLVLAAVAMQPAMAQFGGVGSNLPSAPGFYVSTTGNDSNAGTVAAPFATLGKCQTAMQGSSGAITNCYLRAGTYTPSSVGTGCSQGLTAAVILSSGDHGETWSYYAPDGYDSAVINGQSTGANGLGYGICAGSPSPVNTLTINGLDFQNYQGPCIESDGGTSPVIENNICNGLKNTSLSGTAGISTQNAANGRLIHNIVENTPCHGIATFPQTTNGIENLLIANNFVFNTVDAINGCGGIYLEFDHNGTVYAQSGVVVEYNYVKTVTGGGGGEPIYIDDKSSGVTVTGNVLADTVYQCFFVHGGTDNVASGNICDFGTQTGAGPVSAQQETISMSGNTWENNLVLADIAGTGVGTGYVCNSGTCEMTCTPNGYQNYSGTSIAATGSLCTDTSAVQQITPAFTCGWEYSLPADSAVYSSLPDFPVQPALWGTPGFWGPPGFTIPQTGTTPSPPHTC